MMRVLWLVIMALIMGCALMLCQQSEAGGKKAPVEVEEPIPSPSPSQAPSAKLVTMGEIGPSVNRLFAERALFLMNEAYASGCLKREIEGHKFRSLNSVLEPVKKTSSEAYQDFVKGAPYRLDLRWYYKRFSSTVGYTYNFRDDDWDGGSETRIWSNTKFISTEKMYASHLAHELSHQARAGGFVHYTIHSGSFPYDVGDLMAKCVSTLP